MHLLFLTGNKQLATMEEFFFNCPYCYASVSILTEPLPGHYHYIEDCEVCCRPITLRYTVVLSPGGEVRILHFTATTDDEL
ncbi:CPXCG motif-containing cysteine-rich protein [Schleiferia thermophila]|jgi:hypothetical protein|nr:CPXCG motif-containing cysteine-rich protein [Schleiferia thermophila]